MPDAHQNFATSLVATAPSPATSGTSLVVTAGHGTRFPTAPFNAVIAPADAEADPSNAEVVRVTAISTDTATIVRAQEGSGARTVVVGDRIYAGITAKTLTDAENTFWARRRSSNVSTLPRLSTPQTGGLVAGSVYASPAWCELAGAYTKIRIPVATATAPTYVKAGVWDDSGTLVTETADFKGSLSANADIEVALGATVTLALDDKIWLGLGQVGTGPTFRCFAPGSASAELGLAPALSKSNTGFTNGSTLPSLTTTPQDRVFRLELVP